MKTAALLSLGLAITLLAGDTPPPLLVTKETARTFYRPFKRLTKEPFLISTATSILCGDRVPARTDRVRRAANPHVNTRLHLYANAPATEAIAKESGVFPAGAVIVKEKMGSDGAVVGVGGMIKRAAGFDAKNGDWEYFYSDEAAGFTAGRLANCAGCHADAKATDYVFGAWRFTK